MRHFALGWGRRYPQRSSPQRWVIGTPRPTWLDLVAPPDAAPLPPGSEPDVVIIPHTAAGDAAPVGLTGEPGCGLASLGRAGTRAGSGLLDVFRDGDRPASLLEAPPARAPRGAPHRAGGHRDGPPLERTVVALGARTETLAAHLERLEGRLDRLTVDVRARHDAR